MFLHKVLYRCTCTRPFVFVFCQHKDVLIFKSELTVSDCWLNLLAHGTEGLLRVSVETLCLSSASFWTERRYFVCRPTPAEAAQWRESLDKVLNNSCRCTYFPTHDKLSQNLPAVDLLTLWNYDSKFRRNLNLCLVLSIFVCLLVCLYISSYV